MAGHKKEHHVVIVGTGFAGFNAARELSRLVGKTTEIVVINLTDYSDAGSRRLGHERGHACGTDIARGDHAESVPLNVEKPRA